MKGIPISDYSAVLAEASQRIAALLGAPGGRLTPSDVEEVQSFLKAREYGLAFETLASILADGGDPVCLTVLREIDGIAELLGLADGPFVTRLRQIAGQSAGTGSA